MAVALKLLIERTESALAAATDPKKKLRLERDLASFRLTAAKAEGGDDDADEDDDEDKTGKAAKKAEASKKKAEAMKHKARADELRHKAAEADEEARKAMGDEDDDEDAEAKALRAELAARQSSMSDGAAAALASQAGQDAVLRARLDTLEKERAVERKQHSIDAALTGRRITPGEAATLATKSDAFVADFLAMRPKPIVNTDATQIDQPNMRENADLPPAQMAQIDMMVAALPNLSDVQRAEVKKNMINGRRAIAAGASNGSPGRY